jgi:hypothetical protein
VKLQENTSDTFAMLAEAYEGKLIAFEWNKWIKEGCENVEDDENSCCLRPHTINESVEKVWNLVHSDRRLSINQAYYVEIL